MNRGLWIVAVLAALAFAASFYVFHIDYDRLPEKIPTHWDIRGEVDKYTLKQDAWLHFYAVPGLLAFWVFVTWLLPRISPEQFSLDAFKSTYNYLMVLVAVLFAYLHAVILWNALNPSFGFARPFCIGFFLMFALLGNVIGKTRKNFWVGVRTPWTLADDRVWYQTHRLAGWLWVICGVAGILLSLGNNAMLVTAFCIMIAAAVFPVFYSLYLYKSLQRQGKLTPTGNTTAPNP
jgi:uncharacterized membrane protein